MAHIRMRIVTGKPVKETVPAPAPAPPPDPKAKASDWRTWQATAKDLKKAAKVFESGYPSESGPVYLFLAGLSLENLVKAVLTKKRLQKWTNDKLSWGCNGHNLPGLFKNASITPLKDWEDEFIKRLKRFVEWGGRYPIPNAQKDAAEMNQSAMSTGDPEKFDKLFERLQSILHEP